MKEELLIAGIISIFTCLLLGLRQLIIKGGKKSDRTYVIKLDDGDGDAGTDDPSDEWPSVIAMPASSTQHVKELSPSSKADAI